MAKTKVIKEAAKKELVKYDLGCGQRKQAGYIGVDWAKTKDVDIVANLMHFPYKFAKDGSASDIYLAHFFEHLDGAQRVQFMNECYRILAPGGKVTIIVPYYSSMRAVQDPTHKWPPVAESSFLYFNKKWMIDNGLDHYKIEIAPDKYVEIACDFDFIYGYSQDPNLNVKNDEYKAFAYKNYINSIMDLHVTLTKK